MTRTFWWIVISCCAVAQGANALVRQFFSEQVVYNPGAVFGLARDPLVVAAIIAIGLGLTIRLWRASVGQLGVMFGLGLILGGAISNIMDRFAYGAVLDYLPFFSISTFNVADVEIVVGAVLLAWFMHSPSSQTGRSHALGRS